jgi:uncharacterized protein (DUF1778 family)
MSTPATSDVLQIRISPADKELLSRAAEHAHRSLSDFVRSNALEHAREILAQAQRELVTVVPPQAFDRLMASLDEPAVSIDRLVAAAGRFDDLQLDDLAAP